MSKLIDSYMDAIKYQYKQNLTPEEQQKVNLLRKNIEETHDTVNHPLSEAIWSQVWSTNHDGLRSFMNNYKDLMKQFIPAFENHISTMEDKIFKIKVLMRERQKAGDNNPVYETILKNLK